MKIDFLATGNRFLPFSQTAMDCYRGGAVFSSSGTSFPANR